MLISVLTFETFFYLVNLGPFLPSLYLCSIHKFQVIFSLFVFYNPHENKFQVTSALMSMVSQS